MAFVANQLALVFAGGAGRAKRWQYVTADTIPTVQASGYFDSTVSDQMDIGDIIDVVVVDAVAPSSRAAVTGVERLVVAGKSGTTITTTQDDAGAVGKIIETTAATLTLTAALHAGRTVVQNRAAGTVITLPAATGTGNKYRVVCQTTITSNALTVQVANATDVMQGQALLAQDAADTAVVFEASATTDTISGNGTTTGGLKGQIIEVEDIASGLFQIAVSGAATGTEATPLSAAVS